MGLAGERRQQRIGNDPRNTNWANDTSRFGHRFLVQMGWTPGKGLGQVNHSITTHIKVKVKRDNVGLGANLERKRGKNGAELDAGDNAYLDGFQKLLGRLNGKEEEINEAVDKKRKDRIITGKWGMNFVKGETLGATIEDGEESEDKEEKKHKHKHEHRHKHKHGHKRHCEEDEDEEHHKKKKSKKSKHHHKHHHESESPAAQLQKEVRESTPSSNTPSVLRSRMALRSKWIKQKRAAVTDAKALQEIFMVR